VCDATTDATGIIAGQQKNKTNKTYQAAC